MVDDEIEVNVREVGQRQALGLPFGELLQKLVLASIGAVALKRDEIEGTINRLVERGELGQKDGEKFIREVSSRLQPQPQLARVEATVETGLEQILNRLNIPSKRDIDDLSAKIAQLAARVEELRRTNEQ